MINFYFLINLWIFLYKILSFNAIKWFIRQLASLNNSVSSSERSPDAGVASLLGAFGDVQGDSRFPWLFITGAASGPSCPLLTLPAAAYSVWHLHFSVGTPCLWYEREDPMYLLSREREEDREGSYRVEDSSGSSGVGRREMEDRKGSLRVEDLSWSSSEREMEDREDFPEEMT